MSAPPVTSVTAIACANVALVKYWGKRDKADNQPATGSISIGLDALRTTTELTPTPGTEDKIAISGEHVDIDTDKAVDRIRQYLDFCRQHHHFNQHFAVNTHNNFPTGAGLASSASGFAALCLAVNQLMSLQLNETDLSRLARRGSGSAARSVFGGFVEVIPGEDAFAQQAAPAEHWPLSVVVAITDTGEKPIGSTEAMLNTAASSPCYPAWLDSHPDDMAALRQAIAVRDFQSLATISELNCLKMHAAMMTSSPPIIYWSPATLALIHRIRALRADSVPVFFTIDAGPQVKAVCLAGAEDVVEPALQQVPGVISTLRTPVGGTPQIQPLPASPTPGLSA